MHTFTHADTDTSPSGNLAKQSGRRWNSDNLYVEIWFILWVISPDWSIPYEKLTKHSTHKSFSEKLLNTHRIWVHAVNESRVSLFLVSSFVFAKQPPLTGRALIKWSHYRDHQKKKGKPVKFLGIKLIRHQHSLPASFTHTVYPKIHICSSLGDSITESQEFKSFLELQSSTWISSHSNKHWALMILKDQTVIIQSKNMSRCYTQPYSQKDSGANHSPAQVVRSAKAILLSTQKLSHQK